MTDKTYKTYNVEAKGTIKLWMDVEASSQEEAEALADQVNEIDIQSQVLGDLYMMATLWRSHLFDQNQIDLA